MKASTQRFSGLIAFFVVLLMMPLGHALMILMEHVFGEHYQFTSAFLLGLLGVVLVYLGARSGREVQGTWFGFFGGILVWTGWVEFSYVYFASHLGVDPLMKNGAVATKPEYLVLASSAGLLATTLLYFLFNGRTRCNFFTWLQRHLKLRLREVRDNAERNYSIITFMETTYVLWFFYVLLLLVYDERILGDHHPVTYIVLAGSLVWSLYLMTQLVKHRQIAPAVRYAIPTVVIFWNAVEILGRWGFYREIWIEPLHHIVEMILILLAFLAAGMLAKRVR